MGSKLDAFTEAYIEAALFADRPEDAPPGATLADSTLFRMIRDCAQFQRRAGLTEIPEHACATKYGIEAQAGHDFWLTRNGHGAGFWDGDWIEPHATRLDNLAKGFGSFDLYAGDDGRIHS